MKVLQLITKRQYRGAEVFAANLSRKLVSDGMDVLFVGLYAPPTADLKVIGAKNMDLMGKPSSFLSLRLAFRLFKLIQKEKPDIIQANGSDTLKYSALIKLVFPKLPIVYRNISIISSWIGSNKLKKAFYKTLFSRMSHVTAVGTAAIDDFKQTIAFAPEKCSVIRRGIPRYQINKDAARRALLAEFHLPNTAKIAVHVGNFSPEKNHQFLIQVFSEIKKADTNIKLLLVGEGRLFDEVKTLIANHGLSETVFLAGFRQNIQEIFAGADIALMCSTVEGVPGVLLEAAAQKLPSLAVDVGGIREAVVNGQTGVVLPDHSITVFAENCIALINNENTLAAYGELAYNYVKKEYDEAANYNAFLKLYKTLLNSKEN